MLDELQAEAPDYEIDPLNYLLSVGQSLEEIEQYRKDGIPLWEVARAVHSMRERGESLDDSQRFIARSADEFGEDKTEFVWYPFVPVGDYTVLMADGGTGKTILCCGIAAAISKGEALPGDYFNEWSNTPGNTLIISAEDRGELLKKRLAASGADLKNVYILDCMDSEGMDFTDGYEDFVQTIKRYNPRLVIIDPWHAFLGAGVDINRVNAVRPVFQRLANMAKVCNCGMILVSHVNKRAQGENANNAATGSTDFINAARSALRVIFNDEPGMKDTRILVHTKSNYAEPGKSVVYQILKNSGCNWAGFSEITRKTLEDAARWRKTPHEVIKQLATQAETNSALIDAITEKAIPGKTVNINKIIIFFLRIVPAVREQIPSLPAGYIQSCLLAYLPQHSGIRILSSHHAAAGNLPPARCPGLVHCTLRNQISSICMFDYAKHCQMILSIL